MLTRPQYDLLDDSAKRTAFTVAKVASLDALEKIQEALRDDVARGGTLREFRERVDEAIGQSALSPAAIENVYRTNVAQAYAEGQRQMLAHPLVADEFPYVLYTAVHDGRTRPDHKAMEKHGIGGGQVYRRDDPVIQTFWPPWDFSCRCAVVALTLEDAAARGVPEAKRWLDSGNPPASPTYVAWPPFRPPPGWGRDGGSVRLSVDPSGREHKGKGEGGGQFTSKNGGSDAAATTEPAPAASPLGKPTPALKSLAAHGKAALASGGKAMAAIKVLLGAGFDKLPAAVKVPVTGFMKLAYIGYVAGNKAVKAVALAKGLTEEQASRHAKLATTADFALGGTRSAALMSAMGMPHLAPVAAMLPIGSLAYLAFSTSTDPLATLRAAKTAVGKVAAKLGRKPKVALSMDQAAVELLADRLKTAADPEWYEALVYAALDEAGSLANAIEIADAALAEGDGV